MASARILDPKSPPPPPLPAELERWRGSIETDLHNLIVMVKEAQKAANSRYSALSTVIAALSASMQMLASEVRSLRGSAADARDMQALTADVRKLQLQAEEIRSIRDKASGVAWLVGLLRYVVPGLIGGGAALAFEWAKSLR
jgi:hypothetical protein